MMIRAHRILAVAALALGVWACNGGPEPPAPMPPAPTPTPPSPPAPTPPAPIACNGSRSGGAPEGRDAEDLEQTRTEREVRIVGGQDAPPGAFPFAVAIAAELEDGTLFQYCGGSLIAADWVLTAAHCEVRNGDRVIINRRDLSSGEGEVRQAEFVITHNDYDAETNDNDIALVKLAAGSTAAAVGLVDAADTPAQPGDPSTIVGYGALQEGGSTSDVLQQVTVPIVSNDRCQAGYAGDGISITSNMLCAGLATGGMDSCQGDSGGPLIVRADETSPWQQAGIVSFGRGCARPEKFGVYTRVSQYAGWIGACRSSPPGS